MHEFLQLDLKDDDDKMGAAIGVVFEQAINDTRISALYARMVCTFLN